MKVVQMHIKPPLGIEPKWLWRERRREDLIAAMERYAKVGVKIPQEWFDEYTELLLEKINKPQSEKLV